MFTMTFETSNDAFGEDTRTEATEAARIARDIADRLDDGQMSGRVRDVNGNQIGRFKLDSESAAQAEQERRTAVAQAAIIAEEIFTRLDGTIWNADALEDIKAIFAHHGRMLAEPRPDDDAADAEERDADRKIHD